MSYLIAGQVFNTKEEITDKCREILNNTQDNHKINEADRPFLLELFKYHDEWEEKSLDIADRIEIIVKRTIQGTRCFHIVKSSEEPVDISFRHAIKLIKGSRSHDRISQAIIDFKNAARQAVNDQIWRFRDNELRKSEKENSTSQKYHVDHKPPKTFDQLLFDFCKINSIKPEEVRVGSVAGTKAFFIDNNFQKKWQEYHRNHAVLRLLTDKENLSAPKIKVPWNTL